MGTHSKRWLRWMEVGIVVLGVLLCLGVMVDVLDVEKVGLAWYLWVFSPFVLFGAFRLIRGDGNVWSQVAGCVTAAFMLMFAGFFYLYCFYYEISSTSPLVFLFVPLWMNLGWPVIYMTTYRVGRWLTKQEAGNNCFRGCRDK